MRFFILFAICCLKIHAAHSAEGKYRLGTGVLSYEAFKNTTKENAATDTWGTSYVLPIQGQAQWDVKGFTVRPRVLYTLIPKEAEDQGSTSTVLLGSTPAVFPVGQEFEISFGPGYMLRTIKGKGGSIELGNGSGTTEFGLPARSVTSKNFFLEAGFHYNTDRYVLGLEALGMSLLSERRAVSFLFTLSYKL